MIRKLVLLLSIVVSIASFARQGYRAPLVQSGPSCNMLTIALNTVADSTAVYTLTNGSGTVEAQGTGAVFSFCPLEGCYSVNVTDANAQPIEGTYTISDTTNTVITSGIIVDGVFIFLHGTVVNGCTNANATNHDAQANCDDGSCCTGDFLQLAVFADDFVSTGQADVVIVIAGDTLFNGTLTLAPDPEDNLNSQGVVGLCVPSGCLSVSVSNPTIPLFFSSFLSLTTSGDTISTTFDTDAGFLGSLLPLVELCDGQDNDCDGLVDEDFLWFVDADQDGWGDPGTVVVSCTPPGGAMIQQGGDCDDTNAAILPGVPDPCEGADGIDNNCSGIADEEGGPIWFRDADLDGWGTSLDQVQACVQPPGYINQIGDCDDADSSTFPGALETCDSLDNDCDNFVDEDFIWYVDSDGDGFGVDDPVALSCIQPPGTADNKIDCNDAVTTIFPGAPELCDGLDNDCDGTSDEDSFWFVDADGDGVGNPASIQHSCTAIPGMINTGGDCNDNDAAITVPGAPCDDGNAATFDDFLLADCTCQGFSQGSCPPSEVEDCNGNCVPLEWIGDGTCDDGSFQWNGNLILLDCDAFANDGGDCTEPCTNELCDGQDNDCDGLVDEVFFWYPDADGDGFGDQESEQFSCAPLAGLIHLGGDCDDTDPAIHPGGIEVCDGHDNDCNGITDGIAVDFQSGCMDPMACNYDPNAMCPDASCIQGSIADGSETFTTDFTATDVTGAPVNLFAMLAQGKTVVLDLFTTWCVPSIAMNNSDLLRDWYAHMGPDSLDLIRIVSIEIEDTATVTGSLAPFLQNTSWPFIANGTSPIRGQFTALGLFNNEVPTLVMICPDRSARVIYPQPGGLPFTGTFHYDPVAAFELIDEKCGCRGLPCFANIGCMDLNACNYDSLATCAGPCLQATEWFMDNDADGYGSTSLGTACVQPANSSGITGDCNDNDPSTQVGITLTVFTNDPIDVGSAHYAIQQGSMFMEGDLNLPAETGGVGELPLCIGDDCFNITITPNNVPLFPVSTLLFATSPDDPVSFSTADGYQSTGAAEVCDGTDNDCDGVVDEDCVLLSVRTLLEGPYDAGTGLMDDGLRTLDLIPKLEPYTGMGFGHLGGGGETTTAAVLAVTGSDAVVDWVLLELRDPIDPALYVATRSALVQRDGDVVDTDGVSPVGFPVTPGNYYVSVRHRNHLGCMTAVPVALSATAASVDLSSIATATFGTEARRPVSGAFPAQVLWAGDVIRDRTVKYTGSGNDRDPILLRIGGVLPTATSTGYDQEDVDLSGEVKYTGSGNDRDPVLSTIGGTTITEARTEQLP